MTYHPGRGRPKGATNRSTASIDPLAGNLSEYDLQQTLPQAFNSLMLLNINNHTNISYIRSQLEYLQDLQNPEAPTASNSARDRRPQPFHIRFSVRRSADIQTLRKWTPPRIVEAFKEAANGMERIKAAKIYDNSLRLTLGSLEDEEAIRKRESEVRDILRLSSGCRAVFDQYLVVALYFPFDKHTLANPDREKLKWSEANKVEIVKVFWAHSQLILSVRSLADARSLCKRPSVFLHGSTGIVR